MVIMILGWKRAALAGALCFLSSAATAETVLAAVAANFSKPMNEIAAAFEKSSGYTVQTSLGASGKFVAQLENGAPFEVFLSADAKNPEKLEQDGFVVPGSRFTYAIGKLALWSAAADGVDAEGRVLRDGEFKHLALADPKLAPYGLAAVELLHRLGLYDKLQGSFVQGENIAQTLEFISTGNAELGFVAWSQVSENGHLLSGSVWLPPRDAYPPIFQDAALLKTGAANPAAAAFLEFLKSAEARAIIEKYGYEWPHR